MSSAPNERKKAKERLNLCLDCKVANSEQLAREILDAGMEGQVVVYDRVDHLQRLHAVTAGRVALMAKWREIDPPQWAVSNHLAAVEIDADALTPDVGRTFHALGIRPQAKSLRDWDRPVFWDRVLAAGADWIQTDLGHWTSGACGPNPGPIFRSTDVLPVSSRALEAKHLYLLKPMLRVLARPGHPTRA